MHHDDEGDEVEIKTIWQGYFENQKEMLQRWGNAALKIP